MTLSRRCIRTLCCFASLAAGAALGQSVQEPYQPSVGQAGKNVVWVPTPPALVEKMLDMAQVTPKDFVIDLGSGDGRSVIAAAKRGARALGVEYNPQLVEFSKDAAAAEGVADKARFVQGDMYQAEISQASVLALFLLVDNLRKLEPKFRNLKPGTRIVTNTFEIPGWDPVEVGRAQGDCGGWCTAYLYIVPPKVAGTWRFPHGILELEQDFQTISGTLASSDGAASPIRNARLKGDQISFSAGMTHYTGRVRGDSIRGRSEGAASGSWRAVRENPM
ncbi:MAG TPA: class I SAM-dependent methyltransferase [Burkholderiales bacterium]|nr:class I SAM-dependent methyltransferase [Burkholderiales bacterium]